jgi:hypothetical protein
MSFPDHNVNEMLRLIDELGDVDRKVTIEYGRPQGGGLMHATVTLRESGREAGEMLHWTESTTDGCVIEASKYLSLRLRQRLLSNRIDALKDVRSTRGLPGESLLDPRALDRVVKECEREHRTCIDQLERVTPKK